VAFILSAILLSIYVVAHFIAARNEPRNDRNTQPELRLVNKRIFRGKIFFYYYFQGSTYSYTDF
jgi:hypothetical protein